MVGRIKSIFFVISCYFLIIFPRFATAAPIDVKFMDKSVKDIAMDLAKFLLSVTGGIALLFLIVSGIYFMISGGSTTGRQSAKKMLMTALVGLFLVLISYALLVVMDNLIV